MSLSLLFSLLFGRNVLLIVPAYSDPSRERALCLYEKLEILIYPDPEKLLNKRPEIMARCPHERKYLLSNYDNYVYKYIYIYMIYAYINNYIYICI